MIRFRRFTLGKPSAFALTLTSGCLRGQYIEPPDSDPERPLWVRVIPSEPSVPLLEIDGTAKIFVKVGRHHDPRVSV
eukprot:72487-Rhodomonas_salina.5